MLWVSAADCLKLMIGFCNDDFGFFDWFLGGGRSSNSVVIGGTCKKWTCSTMTSWRKSIEYEEHLFCCYLIRSEDLGTASLSPSTFWKTDRFFVTPCFDRFFSICFSILFFFLLNSRVPVSQPVEQVSSRRGHGTEVASSHFLMNSHCQIFSHVYLNCSSFLSWISSMLRERAEIANSWLLTVKKSGKNVG